MLQVFCSPGRYVQGRDASRALPNELRRLGLAGKAMILASPSARRQLEEVWRTTFPESGLDYAVVDFGGECSFSEISRGKSKAQEMNAGIIVGVGGGKTLDAARAIASELNLPVACCPTTASSDAPCSALSVVYTDEGVFQEVVFFKRHPELVLVDSSIVARAPVRLLIAGMGDALATFFEADTAIRAHKMNVVGGASTMAAAALSRLCYDTLLADGAAALAAARAQVVTPALERIIEANTLLSGLGFESGGLAVAHSVHNGLTAAPETHDRLHGEKVAFGTLVQLVLEGSDRSTLEEVLAFCVSVGLPVSLTELGLASLDRRKALDIAERAIAPGENVHNEPFAVTAEMVADAIYAADEIGRRFRETGGLV
jgi:glycerol dehydrogenase